MNTVKSSLTLCSRKRVILSDNPVFYLSIILGVAIIIVVSVMIAASFYTFPSADDYNYSIETHKAAAEGNLFDIISAAIETHISFFTSWLALYSPAALQSIQPGIFGNQHYWITCPILLGASYFGFAFLIYSLIRHLLKIRNRIWLPTSGLAWLVFILAMPAPSEGLYWWNGGANYIPFWSLAAMSVGLMIKYYCGEGRMGSTIAVATLVSFVVAGSTQINSFALVLMLAYICFFCIICKKKYLSVVPLIVSIAGFLVMAFHPGTAARRAALGIDIPIEQALFTAVKSVRGCFAQWVNLEFVIFVCLLVPLAILALRYKGVETKYFSIQTVFVFAILATLFLFALNCVPAYSLGYGGPGRLRNVVFATFLILTTIEVFLMVGTIVANMQFKHNESFRFEPIYILVYAFLVTMLLIAPNNMITGIRELSDGTLESFRQEMVERFEIIDVSKGKDVVVPALQHRPSLTFFDDIEPLGDDWKNRSYANYYSLSSVRTSDNVT